MYAHVVTISCGLSRHQVRNGLRPEHQYNVYPALTGVGEQVEGNSQVAVPRWADYSTFAVLREKQSRLRDFLQRVVSN